MLQISPTKLFIGACPRALKKYVNEEQETSAYPEFTVVGKMFHDAMEYIIKNMENRDIEEVVDEAIAKFVNHDEEEIRKMVVKAIERLPLEKVVESELELGLDEDLYPTSFEKGVYHGRIDLLIREDEDEFWVIDYKTSFKVYSPESLQIKFYAWLLHKTYPDITKIRVGLYFPRYGELRLSDIISDEDFVNIERTILSKAEQIRKNFEKDEAIPGSYCTYCSWISDCPEANVRFITSEEEARKAAAELAKLEAKVKDLKTKLSRWIEFHGPIDVDEEQELTFKPRETKVVEIPPEKFSDVLQEYPDLMNYISISASRLIKKNHPVLQEYPVKTKSTYTILSFNKKKVGVIN